MENLPQNNNLVPKHFDLGEATDMVLKLKEDVAKGVIALGDWITLVKENLPRTEWIEWLKYEVHVGLSSAYKWMAIAKQFTYRDLEQIGPAKLFEMLSLPEGEFKEELLEKAPNMSKIEVREAVASYQDDEPIEGEPVEEVSRLDGKIRAILEMNADFLDTLIELDLKGIPGNFLDLLENQLKTNIKEVNGYLAVITDVRKTR